MFVFKERWWENQVDSRVIREKGEPLLYIGVTPTTPHTNSQRDSLHSLSQVNLITINQLRIVKNKTGPPPTCQIYSPCDTHIPGVS